MCGCVYMYKWRRGQKRKGEGVGLNDETMHFFFSRSLIFLSAHRYRLNLSTRQRRAACKLEIRAVDAVTSSWSHDVLITVWHATVKKKRHEQEHEHVNAPWRILIFHRSHISAICNCRVSLLYRCTLYTFHWFVMEGYHQGHARNGLSETWKWENFKFIKVISYLSNNK